MLDRHARGVTCAGWGAGGCLALGGRDCQVRAPARDISWTGPGTQGNERPAGWPVSEAGLLRRIGTFMDTLIPLLLRWCRTWQELL